MRVLTASEIKTGRDITTRDLPRPGSAARFVYERLYANRGCPANLDGIGVSSGHKISAIYRLQDDYGCDIRHGKGRGVYILCGEWFGPHYSDYVIEAINAATRSA